MPADLRSAVLKLAENALKQSGSAPQPPPEPKKPVLSTGRAIVLGAGLATAGQALLSGRGRALMGSLRDRVEDQTGHEDEQYEGPEAEDEEDFEDEDDYGEPEAEEDDDFDDEDDDEEPEAEADDDFDDEDDDEEPEAEADDDFEDEEEEPEERPQRRRRARSAR
ncbi:MAG TPA: hypothetical protein VF781_00720 [Solirubrobacteraceae bacterium]